MGNFSRVGKAVLIEDDSGWVKFLNSRAQGGVQAYLDVKAEEFIHKANAIYSAQREYESELPIFYQDSFRVSRVSQPDHTFHTVNNIVHGRRITNIDPTAEWVEFGSHAGGGHKTPVLRYRIFGKTIDSMEV